MEATAVRSGKWWAIEAHAHGETIFTQVRRLEQADDAIRDAFATLGVVGDMPIVRARLDERLERLAQESMAASQAASAAAAAASESSRRAVKELREAGLTVRDVAQVLGLSPQRISQLAS